MSSKSLQDTVNRGPKIVAQNDRSEPFEFQCDEEPHMVHQKEDIGPVGFIPLQLGQTFEDMQGATYEIVRKLGWGHNSSVWLAKRMKDDKEGYVAIKILTANFTRGIEAGEFFELDVWRHFRAVRYKNQMQDPPHPGFKYLVEPQTVFGAESPHGTHLCIVTEPFGSTVDELQLAQPGIVLPLPVVKTITKQTLLALDFLRNEIGLVHADVKAANLLINVNASTEDIEKYLHNNPSETYPDRHAPELWSGPIITVKSQPLPNLGLDRSMRSISVSLGDFGGAVPVDKITPYTPISTPALLRAPEQLLGHPWSTPADIWSVGCMVFECLTGAALFQVDATPALDELGVHIGRIDEHLGPFPAIFLDKCSKRAQFFDDSGNLLRAPEPLPAGKLESYFGGFLYIQETMSAEDVAATCAFLRRCLAIEPSARATAAQLLEDDWLRS